MVSTSFGDCILGCTLKNHFLKRQWQIKVKWWCSYWWGWWWWWTDLWNGQGWPRNLCYALFLPGIIVRLTTFWSFSSFTGWNHSFTTYSKFSENYCFLPPWYNLVASFKSMSNRKPGFVEWIDTILIITTASRHSLMKLRSLYTWMETGLD